jgi:hypothetical protein
LSSRCTTEPSTSGLRWQCRRVLRLSVAWRRCASLSTSWRQL